MGSGFFDGMVAGITWNFGFAVVLGLIGGFAIGRGILTLNTTALR